MGKRWMIVLAVVWLGCVARGGEGVRVRVKVGEVKQEFQGLGCGAIFFERHITSLGERGRGELQQKLYDEMFSRVNTRYLQLMIRGTLQPKGPYGDVYSPAMEAGDFKDCVATVAIAKAAKQRRPGIELMGTLYSPPAWMKSNDSEDGGGMSKATLKPGMELHVAAYLWTFLAHMARNGCAVKYLAIANESDWGHSQPGYYLKAEAYADLFKVVGEYLDTMAVRHPEVPRAVLVGPNTLSAPGAVREYVPAIEKKAGGYLGVVAAHDYDPRGDRWGDLRRLARGRPVWMSEWGARGEDDSPGQINSGIEYAVSMHEAFSGGVNAWFAYDWVYPPRNGGIALIHVDWGKTYTLTKPYWVFRQWGEALSEGMHVVGCEASRWTIKATAFYSEKQGLVVHVANPSDKTIPIVLSVEGGAGGAAARRVRTSATEDAVGLEPVKIVDGNYGDTLPGRSLTTYVVGGR